MINFKKISLILIFIWILFICGCNSSNKITVRHYEVQKDIQDSSKIIQKNIKQIDLSTAIIDKEAIKINNITNNNDVKNSSNLILDENKELRGVKNDLSEVVGKLKIAETKALQINIDSKILIKERNEAIEERDKLKADIQSRITVMLKWIIGASIVGIGVFGALIVFGNIKGGIFGAVSCVITMILAITIGEHFALIAWIGLGILIFGIGIFLYYIYTERKAIKEIITTTEETKKFINDKDRNKIFGDNGFANLTHSKNTINLVKKERNKIAKN